VAILSCLDWKRFGTWITPFSVLGLPYTCVVLLSYFLSEPLGFVPIFVPSVFIWIVGLFLVWASGAFVGWAIIDLRIGRPIAQDASRLHDNESSATKIALNVAFVAILIMVLGTVVALHSVGGLVQVGTPDFKAAYSHGLSGHAVVWSSLLGILLIGTYHRGGRLQLAIIAAITFFVVLGQVKGSVLHVVIGGVLFRVMRGRLRLSLTKILAVLAGTCIIFGLGYIAAMLATDSGALLEANTYSFLSRHYLYYLFSGPLSFSEALRNGVADIGGDWHAIFAPFIDLYHVTLKAGELVVIGSLHEKGMVIDDSGVQDNVYTMFGTLYLYLGAGGAAIYAIVVGFLSYGVLIVTLLKQDAWLTALYCYIAANLAVGFFEFYFWHLDMYELSVLTGMFIYASRFIKVSRHVQGGNVVVPNPSTV
jgi:Family of unknown function (DUF6337)